MLNKLNNYRNQAFYALLILYLLTLFYYQKNLTNSKLKTPLIISESNTNLVLSNEALTIKPNKERKFDQIIQDENISCEKWIVVTTINHPTQHVKYLNDALHGWCIVVASDKKTPSNWNYKFIHFLSLDSQIKMAEKYQIIHDIPFNSYLRKMCGYLYAIESGAQFIYETDDDNAPLDGLFGFRYETFKGVEMDDCGSSGNQEIKFINPYSYFGQPSMWPRGYPLELISSTASNYCKKYKLYDPLNEKYPIPLIQQGLVNGDPDMDAIYRLTRKLDNELLNVKFDENAPGLVLSKKGQYAPFNSQNTLFHYDSFWSLVFPSMVTFREVDILRGYIAIRLLQEMDGRLGFIAPNAFQIRNSHSYHSDYKEEKRLYDDIYAFVKVLDEWQCDSNLEFKDCLLSSIQTLIEKDFLKQKELNFYRLWVKSLDKMGYKWPKRTIKQYEKSFQSDLTVYFKAVEQEHSSNSNKNEESFHSRMNHLTKMNYIKNMCQFDLKHDLNLPKMDNLILLTLIDNKSDLEYLNSFLSVHFTYLVVCVEQENSLTFNFTNYLYNSSSMTILILTENVTLSNCVNHALSIGFMRQSFLFIKNIKQFPFWSEKIVFEHAKSDTSSNYFIRTNVANGIRSINFNQNSNIKDYCAILRDKRENSILNSLNFAINSLLWHQNDLASEYCQNLEYKTIWMPDFHDGPRVDLTTVLVHLGQNVILAGTKGYASPYPNFIKLANLSKNLSKYVHAFSGVDKRSSSEELVKENYEYYKNDSDFKNVDYVICSFTASLCEGFIPLNKTIIFNPAHRYNIGRCGEKEWLKLNENLMKLKSKHKLIPSAMSKYDSEYLFHFTGLKATKLYAYGGFYAKNVRYNPIKSEILVGPTNSLGRLAKKLLDELKKLSLNQSGPKFNHIRELYKRYELQDLANHRAIVIFPYAVMSYSIVDFYASNLPIFVPSMEFLIKNRNVDDRILKSEPYCDPRQFKDIPAFRKSRQKFSPNDDDSIEAQIEWLKYADYYHWPYVTVFNSFEELLQLLKTLNLNEISEKMKQYNKIKETLMLDSWCKILKHDTNDSTIPKSYQEAMQYFQIERIHVK
jgi:hypothetical protein